MPGLYLHKSKKMVFFIGEISDKDTMNEYQRNAQKQ